MDALKACGDYEKRANESSSHRLIKSRHFDLPDINPVIPSTDVIQLPMTRKTTTAQVVETSAESPSRTALFRTTITRTIMLHLLINPVSRYTLFFQLPKPFKFDTKPQNTNLITLLHPFKSGKLSLQMSGMGNRQKNSQLIELKTVFISLAHTLILVPYDYKTCIPYLNYLKCLIVQSSKTNPEKSVNTGR